MQFFRKTVTRQTIGVVLTAGFATAPFNTVASGLHIDDQNTRLGYIGQNHNVINLSGNKDRGWSIRSGIGVQAGAGYDIQLPQDVAGIPQEFRPFLKPMIDGQIDVNGGLCVEGIARFDQNIFYAGIGVEGCLSKGTLKINPRESLNISAITAEIDRDYEAEVIGTIANTINDEAANVAAAVRDTTAQQLGGMISPEVDAAVTGFVDAELLPRFQGELTNAALTSGRFETAVDDTMTAFENSTTLPDPFKGIALSGFEQQAVQFSTAFESIPVKPSVSNFTQSFGGNALNAQQFNTNMASGGVFGVVGVEADIHDENPYTISIFAEGRGGYGGSVIMPEREDTFGFHGFEASVRGGVRVESDNGFFAEAYGEVHAPIEQRGPSNVNATPEGAVFGIQVGFQF